MLFFNYSAISKNKTKFFKLFCRAIIKSIMILPVKDQILKDGLKKNLKKFC
jgi:hypothetical protein